MDISATLYDKRNTWSIN